MSTSEDAFKEEVSVNKPKHGQNKRTERERKKKIAQNIPSTQ